MLEDMEWPTHKEWEVIKWASFWGCGVLFGLAAIGVYTVIQWLVWLVR